jgi:hypothetical protein
MEEKPMLRCTRNTNAFVDLTLTHIGLFIATAILLTVVFLFVFSNQWQRAAELESLADDFSNLLIDIDTTFFDSTTRYQFPKKDYSYDVKISCEYLIITAEGTWENHLCITHRFFIRTWPRFAEQNWTTGNDFHVYLNKTCGHYGTQHDAIPLINFTSLCQEYNETQSFFASHPLPIFIQAPIYLEKITIYYDTDKNHDFLLVYQLS